MRYRSVKSSFRIVFLLMTLVIGLVAGVRGQTKLLRFPDIHGERVVFTYGGDLWLAPVSGWKVDRLHRADRRR